MSIGLWIEIWGYINVSLWPFKWHSLTHISIWCWFFCRLLYDLRKHTTPQLYRNKFYFFFIYNWVTRFQLNACIRSIQSVWIAIADGKIWLLKCVRVSQTPPYEWAELNFWGYFAKSPLEVLLGRIGFRL